MRNFRANSAAVMVAVLSLLFCAPLITASGKKKPKNKKNVTATVDSVAQQGIPAISKFVKPSAVVHRGMVNVYEQDNKYYMEIPDSLYGRDIFVFVSLIRGSAQNQRTSTDMMGYGGDALYSKTVRFAKGPHDKVLLEEPIFTTLMPDSTSDLYAAVQASSMMPIAAAFDIKARSDSSELIDFTEMYKSDHPYFSLKGAAELLKTGAYQADKSYPTTVSTYANNVIFRSIRSYGEGKAPKVASGATTVKPNPTIWEVASSWYLLPKEPMRPRYADNRVGYFSTDVTDYTRNPAKAEQTSIANRWRLEPRPEDVDKYKRGELVEPQKPIVFYVDRATPEYLQPYVIQAVEAWEPVLECAGFKNAIKAKLAPTPEEDPNFSMEDARYSVISYKASPIPNAYGPEVADPRSGEIICSHVGLFHSVISLAENWYFAQTAAVNPEARKFPYSEQLRGELIRYVITHEIGHTLGLRHNFGSSWTYKLSDIRNKEYVKKYGHGPSIMDYMRFNYAAQPGDGIVGTDLFPRIGDYDKFAIEWGYKYLPQCKDAKEEKEYLSSWTTQQRKANAHLIFGTEIDPEDPRFQSEDLSDNTIKANELGINNLKTEMAHVEEWTSGADDEEYTLLKALYQALIRQYWVYANHAAKFIGGRYRDAALRSENGITYQPVEKAKQQEAMDYLRNFLFTDQRWLFNNHVQQITSFDGDDYKRRAVARIYTMLLSKSDNLIKHENLLGDKAYTVKDMTEALYQTAFGHLATATSQSQFDRDKQSEYVKAIVKTLQSSKIEKMPAVFSQLTAQLDRIATLAKSRAPMMSSALDKSHLLGLSQLITHWTKGEKNSLTN